MNDGAKYHKCDFQVHTPRDLAFVGKECVTEEERKEYSKNFVKACRDKGLDAVAITDHHDLAFFPYIKQASDEEVDGDGNLLAPSLRLVVFPGLELTLDVPCQALLLFDSKLDITDASTIVIYTALGIQNPNPKTSSRCARHIRLPFKSINDVYEKLNAIEQLRNRFIVFPNVKENGGDSILRDGFYNEYANGVFVGGYLDIGQYARHKSKVGWNNIIDGKTNAYGNRSIGVFQTSDNRTDTFEHLGTSASWVKWSVNTCEALRQACLAKKSRILQEEPNLPLTRISRVAIKGSTFLKDLDIDFNPQFNICIGGRGTGKSSLLQYLSWALGKDNDVEKKQSIESFIQNTLTGSVELDVVKNGISHSVKRSPSSYQIKIGEEDWRDTDSQTIGSILRADSFAQKELSKHEKDRTTQLTRIIENTVDSGVESIRRKLEENGNTIKEVAVSFEAFLVNRRSAASLTNQIDSIEGQIKVLNAQLSSSIPAGDKETIEKNSLVANEKDLIKASDSQLGGLYTLISGVLETANLSLQQVDEANYANPVEVKTFVDGHNQILTNIKGELTALLNKLTNPDFETAKDRLRKSHADHDVLYIEAKGRQVEFEKIIQEVEELRQRLGILIEDRQRLTELIAKQDSTIAQLKALFFERNTLNLSLHDLIVGAAANVVSKSEGSLEIEVTALENIDSIFSKFIKRVTGSKGQSDRTSTFLKTFITGNNTYKHLLKFWLSIYKSKWSGSKIEDTIKKYGLENTSLLETDFDRISESLTNAQIIELSLELPTYNLRLQYCKDSTNKIPFEDASYGQQAGSILTILLNQEFGPLLIDQPEDDLDNKVIQQIADNIVSAKHKRQIIFSSHNANIAVNGDAELILTFDHNSDKSAGEIISRGSIDDDEIKRHVKEIMEGGSKAFELRKVKYGF